MTDVATPTTPRRLRGLPTWVIVLAVVLVLVLVALLLRATPRDADRRVAVDRNGRDQAVLRLASGADSITVTAGDLGGDLAVVTTPDGSRARPLADVDGDEVTVRTTDAGDEGNLWDGGDTADGADGPADVTVRLAEDVRWDVVIAGGSQHLELELGSARVARVEVRGGQGSVDATLPRPGDGPAGETSGLLTLEIAGGAGSVAVHAPDGVPARVTLAAGAGSAALDGDRRQGSGAGTVLTSPGWSGSGERIDVLATTGLGTFTLDRDAR